METVKKTANVFGIILSFAFSIVLTGLLLTGPVVSAVCSFTEAKTIHKVIKDINFVELVTQHEDLRVTLEQYGVNGEFIDGVSETELVEDLIYAYVDSIFEDKVFNASVAEEIVLNHKEESVSLFRRLAEEQGNDTQGISDDEFYQIIIQSIQTEWDTIVSSLPSAEDMGINQENYREWEKAFGNSLKPLHAPAKLRESTVVQNETAIGEISLGMILVFLRSGLPLKVMAAAIAVLTLLILLIRWPRFKGFLWSAVIYLLAAVLMFVSAGLLPGIPVQNLLPSEGVWSLLVWPVLSVFSSEFVRWGIWICVSGIVLLAVYIAGKCFLKKRKQLADGKCEPKLPEAEAALVLEIAEESCERPA